MLLRKGRQRLIGPVFIPSEPPTCVIIVKRKYMKMGVIVNNCTKRLGDFLKHNLRLLFFQQLPVGCLSQWLLPSRIVS